LLFEELGEPVDLIGGDRDAPTICQALPYVLQHITQTTRKPGSVDERHRFTRCRLAVNRSAK
jgi:hypothetical protein